MFLSVDAITLEACGEVIIPFPSGGPFVHRHDLVAVTNGRVNLDGIPLHDLVPFYSVNLGPWRFVDLGLDRGAQVFVVQYVIRQSICSLVFAGHSGVLWRARMRCMGE